MTSREALDELRVILFINYGTKENAGIFIKNLLKPIEKDLEVLDILKSYFNIWKNIEGDFVIEFSNEPVIVITKEAIENKYEYCGKELKIKEWLEENDK